MAGHTPWNQIKHKRRWELTGRRKYRPWWGLGLVTRERTMVMTREGYEDAIRADTAELAASFPKWDFELRRRT